MTKDEEIKAEYERMPTDKLVREVAILTVKRRLHKTQRRAATLEMRLCTLRRDLILDILSDRGKR